MDGKLGCAAMVLALLATGAGVARATDDGDKAAARDLAKAAKYDLDAGRLEDAERKFERAYAMARVPTLAVWTARVLVKRGRLVAGSELYRQAAQLSPNDLWIGNAQAKAQADAQRELVALELRIPKMRVRVQGARPGDVELTIDDVKVESAWAEIDLPADPGRHRIVGKRSAQTSVLAIDLREGERKDAVLTFDERTALAEPAASPGEPTSESGARALLVFSPAQADSATNLTANSLPPEPAKTGHPVYERWWFWTGVGAVVIAGAVTAIVLTRHSGGVCSGAGYPCVVVQ